MQWHQTNDKQYVYANEIGKILAKINLKEHYWEYDYSEYLTLEQTKAAVETKITKANDIPWIS